MASEGSREIEAVNRRLVTAKLQASSANQMAQSARSTLESLQKSIQSAKTNLQIAETQVEQTRKEVEAAEKYVAESEKRWEVIDIDDADDEIKPAGDDTTKKKGNYKSGILHAISSLNDRNGSSSIAIKKHMQTGLPKDIKFDIKRFLEALKKAVADGDLVQVKNFYKLSAEYTKKRRQRRTLQMRTKKAAPEKAALELEKGSEVIDIDDEQDTDMPTQDMLDFDYKAGIINAISTLKDRSGSSSIAIKKHIQANFPKDEYYVNDLYIAALNNLVADGDITRFKGLFKLRLDIGGVICVEGR